MAAMVQVGTIFIDNRPLILRSLGLESESYTGTWSILQSLNSSALDQKIRGSGWNCFFLASEVKTTVLGGLAPKSILKALKQIFVKVRKPDFNCLEVTKIVEKHFFGVPYTTIYAHSRHIQQGCVLELMG